MKRNAHFVSVCVFSLCLFMLAGGCDDAIRREREMQQRQDALAKMNAQQAQEIRALQAREKELQAQLDTLQKIGDKRPDEFIKIARIRISRYTGGVNRDKKPGHESVKIMFTPEDSAGDPVKTAGAVKIELYDLSAKDKGDKQLATFCYTPKEALKFWAGGAFTNHYSFTLPLPEKFTGGELTVRVEFTDYMSGKTFSDQKICKIEPQVKK